MEYLLNPINLKELQSFSKTGILFAFDFDGTLAPIVEEPSEAKMSSRVESLLSELNSKVPVALITGRSLADITPRISFRPKFLIGNHGIEGSMTDAELEGIKILCQSWKDTLNNLYQTDLEKLGATLEDKTYTLTVHYRNAKDPAVAQEQIPVILKTLNDCKVSPGKSVFNVTPIFSINKGEALERLMKKEGYRRAFFIGDDKTDEDVFVLKNPNIFTVKVGDTTESKANFFIKNQREIEHLLESMLKFA